MSHQWGSAILEQWRPSTFARSTSLSGKWASRTIETFFSLGGNAERTFLLDLLLKRNFNCPDQPISEWCIPADQTWLTYLRPKLAELEKERWLFGKFWEAPAWFSLQESWGISTWILPPGFGFCLEEVFSDAATCLMVTAFCHVKTKIDKLFNKGPDSKYMGASLMAQMVKTVPPMLGLTPGLGRPPGEGNGNPLQYPCLDNSMDRGAWRATVLGVAKSQTQLSNQCT